mmetsp:Transcript_4270/g.15646  ORF Transcript_4270/g.15646 Transcript_4270/m.15646 type:complete len:207 (+) Transcript_4270:1264-1884(+)
MLRYRYVYTRGSRVFALLSPNIIRRRLIAALLGWRPTRRRGHESALRRRALIIRSNVLRLILRGLLRRHELNVRRPSHTRNLHHLRLLLLHRRMIRLRRLLLIMLCRHWRISRLRHVPRWAKIIRHRRQPLHRRVRHRRRRRRRRRRHVHVRHARRRPSRYPRQHHIQHPTRRALRRQHRGFDVVVSSRVHLGQRNPRAPNAFIRL